MKKIFALLLAFVMVFSLVGCGEQTVAGSLVDTFKNNADKSAQEIADAMLENPAIQFMGATIPVEAGYLTGFDNVEITGFDEGVMFGPAIGTIPFVGYVFTLSEGTDADEFMSTLEENANLRWNICTEADEMVVESKGDKVFFVMAPFSFEETEGDSAVAGDMAVADDGAVVE